MPSTLRTGASSRFNDEEPSQRGREREKNKAFTLAALTAVLSGCATLAPAWNGKVEWPTEDSARLVGQPMEAGAALAAAGAVRELVKTDPFPDLFQGCASPEQGLDAAVFTGPTPGLYYVVLHPPRTTRNLRPRPRRPHHHPLPHPLRNQRSRERIREASPSPGGSRVAILQPLGAGPSRGHQGR